MRRLTAFNQVTLDGYFAGPTGDFRWAHKDRQDAEWNAFVSENASGGGALLFGRITYELMASYWPTPVARENDPIVAERMNAMPKFVCSRSLAQASWSNTTRLNGDLAAEIRKLKQQPGDDIAILGSGSICAQLAKHGLIDEFQIVVNPVALGKGKTMFEGIAEPLPLKLIKTRVFGNGNVLLCYQPA